MSEPTIRKPTKKSFHFPRATNGTVAQADKQADNAGTVVKTVVEARAKAAPKASRQKRTATVEAKPVAAAVEEKPKRARKEKVVRDSFTMPKSDYAKIAILKQKCVDAGVSVKKSELLRAGLLLLASVPEKRLLAAVSAVETVKTGRPAKS
ncbi:hypothetical protein [Paraburkholderia gardini]|uniref:Uncharacterized protein n=1 Tax=Paraburkholderia gardini TaxID=2823469 RepID=A0ABN7QET6_9BURK|nr:hypothetical protein [Paraburkholderia gardini]CAG4888989.1 hypothetical protein R54767_00617 [Paraburkholderia gardini]